MKLKKYAYRCLAVVCAVVAVSCMDDQYRLDEVNTEVSVMNEKTVLPVGNVERRTLGELLEGQELPEIIVRNEDGSYEVKYQIDTTFDAGEDFELKPSFEIPGSTCSFPVSLPKLSLDGMKMEFETDVISIPALDPIIEAVEGLQGYVPGLSGNEIAVEELYFDYGFPERLEISSDPDEPVVIEIAPFEFELPTQIKDIDCIVFASEENDPGAKIEFDLNLNGLRGVNAGGDITFTIAPNGNVAFDLFNYNGDKVDLVDGKYEIFQDISENNENNENNEFDSFVFYISKAHLLNDETEVVSDSGVKSIDLSMTCEFTFNLDLKAGNIVLVDDAGKSAEPTFKMSASVGLADAEVLFDTKEPLFAMSADDMGSESFNIKIDNLPEQLQSIKRIDLSKDTKLTLYADGLDWLAKNGDAVSIDMTLPKELVLKKIDGMGYEFDEQEHMLSMSIADLCNEEGVQIGFEAIDFGSLEPDNGSIAIEFNPAVNVHFSSEESVSVMGFFPPKESINVIVGLENSVIGLESVSAKINFSDEIEMEPFETGIGDLLNQEGLEGLKIGGAGLSPVIELSIYNPFTLSANIAASIVPMVGDERKEDTVIAFKAVIKGAEYDELTGEITPVETKVVLAKPNRREEFAGEDCVFIECDIDALINMMPTHLAFSASYGLNDDITLHMIDSFKLGVGVNFSLPIAFDDKLHIAYEHAFPLAEEGKESPLAEISAIEGIKVGDIALIAKLATTLPLEFKVSTILLDENGEVLPTVVGFAEGSAIHGSKDGVTEAQSELRLQFDLAAEDGSLEELSKIHSVLLKAEANSVAEGVVSLKDDQYIEASMKLEIDGGVTVDFSKFNK